jgi:dCMP deaminase
MRASWDIYFMSLARAVATRATCPRKQVGCVIVRDRVLLSTGYNGALRGAPHCTDPVSEGGGCLMSSGHCVATVHAEANAVIQAARNGVRLEGSTVYVTLRPCFNCLKLVVGAGIARIVFAEDYGDFYPYAPDVTFDRLDPAEGPRETLTHPSTDRRCGTQ